MPASRSNQVPTFPPALHSTTLKLSGQSTRLPRPITIPEVMTLKTLADVRKLLEHIPKERWEVTAWRNVEKHIAGADVVNVSVAWWSQAQRT